MEKNMTTYEFREWESDGYAVSLEFTVDDDEMNCAKFHEFCKKFALAVGYMPETVEKFFGPTQYDEMYDY